MTLPQPPFRVRTIYSWSGTEEDDLGFIEGDIIEVDSLGDGNWWHGRLKRNKMKGSFPSNYVELIKSDLPNFSASLREGLSSTPSPQRAPKNSSLKLDTSEDELNFSFQSSRNYYTDARHTSRQTQISTSNSPLSPYSHGNKALFIPHNSDNKRLPRPSNLRDSFPHSKSVPSRMEDQVNSRRATRPTVEQMHYASQPNFLSAPPPPQHSVPFIKSKSSFNLRNAEADPLHPGDPYSSSRVRSNVKKQTTMPSPLFDSKPSSDFVAPYDPESLTQSRSTISRNSNVFTYSQGSYFSSSQSSHDSSMAMSDFSATSAGSFARHKYDDTQRQREQAKINSMKISASGNNLLAEGNKIKSSSPSILRKFFSTKETPPLPKVEALVNNSNQSLEEQQMHAWIEHKIDLNRANSLSAKERQVREKRVRENEGYLIFEPHKQVSTINTNEVLQNDHKLDLTTINLTHVDTYVRTLKTSPSVMSPEDFIANDLGMKYSSKLEYIRALFILCAEHFEIIDEAKDDQKVPAEPDIREIFRTKESDSYGMAYLFRYLAGTMGLNVQLIVGSLKTPQSIVRHYWNCILINGEWRFIDVSLGNLRNPIYELIFANPKHYDDHNESFYFLSEPLNFIHTHIPDKFEEQHVVPPIDPMVALALPPCFPSFFRNGLKIHKFNNALTKLQNFEIFEIDLKIPKDVEINAMVLTKTSVTNTLAQVYWKHNERFCKVKGYLPEGEAIGFINIYSGLKGSQKSLNNIHPLSLVIPITHEGKNKPMEFVTRFPTLPAQQNDIYVKHPQNKTLKYGNDYIFNIQQHPSHGLTSISNSVSKLKIALQSPSGKIIKLEKKDLTVPFGIWELSLKCNEIGIWRGLISVDNTTSLCVFAEWSCV